ncbi:Mu transposase C-terminal domain-containing protein [Ferrovibrio sp.]|uniref:Mu transposase C-terminal domain-containing protein n=1 Tax=Ferrovibrio sp. TaxID=1917215 RepID=UPI00311DE5BF
MAVLRIAPDMTLWLSEEPHRVCVVTKDGMVIMESLRRRQETVQIPYDDVASQILAGTAAIKVPANPGGLKSVNLPALNDNLKRDLDGLPPQVRQEFERRWSYVSPLNGALLKRLKKKIIEQVIADVAKRIGDAAPPSYDTVRRWFRDFLAGHRCIGALFPSTGRSGWRTRRLPPDVSRIAREVIIEIYMTPERNSIRATYDAFCLAIERENQKPGRSMPLPCPSLRWLYKEIDRQFDGYEQALARSGKIAADLKYRTWGRGPRPTRALERVEIDHTVLDLIVVDDEFGGRIGRPTITAAIDVATRMIVGFHVSFDSPSIHSVGKCLINVITPKKDILARYPEIKNSWDAYGVPETIVVDNGREFHSKAVEEACRHLNIQVHHTPRRQPWQKPKVERLFGILNSGLLSGMPGRTFSNSVVKGDYKPEKNAVIGFATFVKILHIWVVDDYNQRPRAATMESPADAWRHSIAGFPPVPARAEDLNFAFSHIYQRTVQPTGIQLHNLRYQHEALSRMLRQAQGSLQVTVKLDSDDLSSILVIDPESGQAVRVPCIDPEYTTGLTLTQHHTIMRFRRRTSDDRIRNLSRAETRELIRILIADDRAKNRKGLAKAMAQYAGRDSNHPEGLLKAPSNPELLAIAQSCPQDSRELVLDEDPDGTYYADILDEEDDDD